MMAAYRPRVRAATSVITLLAILGCEAGTDAYTESYARIVREEDARGALGLAAVREHLEHPDGRLRALAVRALGRLEDPEMIPWFEGLSEDSASLVRSSVAWAFGQAVYGSDGGLIVPHVEAGLSRERDPLVIGAWATTAGRILTADPAGRADQISQLGTAQALLSTLPDPSLAGRLGLARGLEALARQHSQELTGPEANEVARLAGPLAQTRPAAESGPADSLGASRLRALATAALAQANRLQGDFLASAARDPWPEVRRQALLSITRHGSSYRTLVPDLLTDVDGRVRVDALAAFDRWLRPTQGCGPLLRALGDPNPHVALSAVALLAKPCPDRVAQRDALTRLVAGQDTVAEWHLPARALWALGGVAPEGARQYLGVWATHRSPFARAWVARAATQTGSRPTLRTLAEDADANVRTAAILGLDRLEGDGARQVYRSQLASEDPQLVMTAVRLLRNDDGEALAPAGEALRRFTALKRENSRDVRMALLRFLAESPGVDPDLLEPYVSDYDPAIAQEAASFLRAATSNAVTASAMPLHPQPPPTAQRLAALARSNVVLDMAAGGRVVIRLRPDLAATNADRFARLAETGYLDGLTLHRVVPNFVIQGGSPGANEYWGDALFSRDEISDQVHWRGTVGLSTRGRDTGDGQLFVNLVDNPRLDFNYTIYGEVVEGLDVVDGIQEGAVILKARRTTRRDP